jgi:hypothetical protein
MGKLGTKNLSEIIELPVILRTAGIRTGEIKI